MVVGKALNDDDDLQAMEHTDQMMPGGFFSDQTAHKQPYSLYYSGSLYFPKNLVPRL